MCAQAAGGGVIGGEGGKNEGRLSGDGRMCSAELVLKPQSDALGPESDGKDRLMAC